MERVAGHGPGHKKTEKDMFQGFNFLDSGNPMSSCWRPMLACLLVGFKQYLAALAAKYKKENNAGVRPPGPLL